VHHPQVLASRGLLGPEGYEEQHPLAGRVLGLQVMGPDLHSGHITMTTRLQSVELESSYAWPQWGPCHKEALARGGEAVNGDGGLGL
jgi:hypothetical protein